MIGLCQVRRLHCCAPGQGTCLGFVAAPPIHPYLKQRASQDLMRAFPGAAGTQNKRAPPAPVFFRLSVRDRCRGSQKKQAAKKAAGIFDSGHGPASYGDPDPGPPSQENTMEYMILIYGDESAFGRIRAPPLKAIYPEDGTHTQELLKAGVIA